ncbi:MAG: SufB/SufD family protein [Anaerovoracaceae bacterium]|jgi:Fe-S cluster assembly scaffold protein SufB
MLDPIQMQILKEVANLDSLPTGAVNIRVNGKAEVRNSTAHIDIIPKEDGSGIDIHIKPGTKNETVHIPVVLSKSGLTETVYNDFFVGDDCDVIIVAGCGIDNCGGQNSEHDGIHRFQVGKNCKVRYIEKHFGSGTGTGKRILNPRTEVYLGENSTMEMEMTQIKGVDDTKRDTIAKLSAGSKLNVRERLMTHDHQNALSKYHVDLDGDGSSSDIVSRGVARDHSNQTLELGISGNALSSGHTECDSIIMDDARILAIPSLEANNPDASLVHEAAIGRIAGDQLIKLMTLGLTEQEAEQEIIAGFLR